MRQAVFPGQGRAAAQCGQGLRMLAEMAERPAVDDQGPSERGHTRLAVRGNAAAGRAPCGPVRADSAVSRPGATDRYTSYPSIHASPAFNRMPASKLA